MNKFFSKLILSVCIIFGTTSLFASENIQFALDWKFEGPSAPYFYAIDKGHFKDEHLVSKIKID